MKNLRQTSEYANYMRMIGWKVVRLNLESPISNLVFIKKIPLLGNIAKLQRPLGTIDPRSIDKFARKHNIAVFYFEPVIHSSLFVFPGFTQARETFLPSRTIQINLEKTENELLSAMRPKTRYNIGLARRRGINIVKSDQINLFSKFWSRSAIKRGMFLPQSKEIKALWDAFGNKASLLFAYSPDSKFKSLDSYPIAGVLVIYTLTAAYYMYAFSTKEGKKLFAPSLLVWEVLKLAKKMGCKIFDFEGVYDNRYKATKSWKGFTKFKLGFGGKTVEYPPTLVKYCNPIARILRI